MTMIITDYEVFLDDNDEVVGPGERLEVTAAVNVKPLYVLVDDKWYLDQRGSRTVVPEYSTGAWTLVLPGPDECLPSDPVWTLTRADGISFTGHIPDVPGPVSVYDLVTSHGWVLVPVPVEPYLLVTTTTTAPALGTADSLPAKPSGYYQTRINNNLVWIPYWNA